MFLLYINYFLGIIEDNHKQYNGKGMKTRVTTETHTKVEVNTDSEERMEEVAPKGIGMLDMVIAFDTTGSMLFGHHPNL